MAAVHPQNTEPAGYKSSNNYIGLNSQTLARKLAERTIENSVPYLLPVLNSLPPDFTLLDVGCGPCSITIDIATRFPHATILGLDSPDALAIARENITAAGVTNITLVAGDALDLRAAADLVPAQGDGGSSKPDLGALLRNGGFDIAHTHQVMLHVKDAARLMCELHNAVKPRGGLVCCRDADIDSMTIYPEFPLTVRGMSYIGNMISNHGGDPKVGRKYLEYALKAGFRMSDIESSVGVMMAATKEERRSMAELFVGGTFNKAESTAKNAALVQGGLSPEEINQIAAEWEAWAQTEHGWFALINPQIVCRRNA